MKKRLCSVVASLVLLMISAAASADRRPHEGRIASIDKGAQTMVVQGEKGDQWQLMWSETTKLKNGLLIEELKVGDSVHFDFVEKDGVKLLTELRRTKKAD